MVTKDLSKYTLQGEPLATEILSRFSVEVTQWVESCVGSVETTVYPPGYKWVLWDADYSSELGQVTFDDQEGVIDLYYRYSIAEPIVASMPVHELGIKSMFGLFYTPALFDNESTLQGVYHSVDAAKDSVNDARCQWEYDSPISACSTIKSGCPRWNVKPVYTLPHRAK